MKNPCKKKTPSFWSVMLVIAVLILGGSRAPASIVIDQVSFHKSFTDMTGGGTGEGTTYADNGGALFIFVRNTGATIETFYNKNITLTRRSRNQEFG